MLALVCFPDHEYVCFYRWLRYFSERFGTVELIRDWRDWIGLGANGSDINYVADVKHAAIIDWMSRMIDCIAFETHNGSNNNKKSTHHVPREKFSGTNALFRFGLWQLRIFLFCLHGLNATWDRSHILVGLVLIKTDYFKYRSRCM